MKLSLEVGDNKQFNGYKEAKRANLCGSYAVKSFE